MKKVSILIVVLICSINSHSQDDNWMSFPAKNDSTPTKTENLDFNKKEGTVTIYEDQRIPKLEAFVRSGEEGLDGVLVDGYRLLIYFDQDKSKSEQQKSHFMNLYDEHKTYIDYLAPNYRVRVGNFRTKLEAEKLKQEILLTFPTAVVVKDKIQLPTLDTGVQE
ncbi:MAG: hypothetical protein BM555_07085 [Crocinitomix sp. MedPE-SWsnd]|nr:MAG: hypothetical protein BM555_07085 [Crocinitomix sp. MedPE-SWsnd]